MNALLALLIIAYVVLAAFFKFPSWVEPIPPKETTARTFDYPVDANRHAERDVGHQATT